MSASERVMVPLCSTPCCQRALHMIRSCQPSVVHCAKPAVGVGAAAVGEGGETSTAGFAPAPEVPPVAEGPAMGKDAPEAEGGSIPTSTPAEEAEGTAKAAGVDTSSVHSTETEESSGTKKKKKKIIPGISLSKFGRKLSSKKHVSARMPSMPERAARYTVICWEGGGGGRRGGGAAGDLVHQLE